MSNAIATAVAPIKTASINAAVEAMQKMVNEVLAQLEADGWDANVSYKYPSSLTCNRKTFLQGQAMYRFVRSITETVSIRGPREPHIVKASETNVARVLELAAQEAADQYDAYVAKLVAKVGECESATLGYNNGVWFDSDLIVVKPTGKEVWNTKCIVNRSCLGKVFNQFPTRKRK